ncbi:MAG: amino acid permease [Bacteroidales bacterium]|nr:amino acid permease [Bacteroidales bacterium]
MKEQEYSFKKSLNLFDSTAIVIGSMIGSGIFIVSSDMSRILAAPGWLMLAWIITGIMTMIAALSYGELASLFPKAGGQYIYLREAYNPLFGFLYGWTLFLVIQAGTIAAVAMAFAKFSGVLFPAISESRVWLNLGFIKFNNVHIVAISSVLFLTYINTKGIKTGKYIQNIFTYTKTLVLILFIIIGLFIAKNYDAISLNKAIFWDTNAIKNTNFLNLGFLAIAAAIAMSMVGSLFTSDAWNNITFTSAEVKNPKRTIPLSLFLGTLIVTIIYLLANYVYITVLPLRGSAEGATVFERGMQFATNDRLGTAAMSSIFGDSAALIMAVLVVISTFGCNNGLIIAGARVYYAMAQDKLFFRNTGKLNSKGVPKTALIIQGIWASMLCLSGTYGQLLDYVVFAVLIFYVLTIAGIFILRKKMPDTERPYKAFGYPVLPLIYIILAVIVMFFLLIYKPEYTWPGLIIVLLGIPVYFIWKKLNQKQDIN